MDLKTSQLNKAIAKKIGAVRAADEGVALRIRCVGYAESSSHYADAVLVSATSLTLSIDGSADTTVGSSGVLAFATYTTLGSLVDAINASSNWEAEIVAGLRSDTVSGSELLARSTSTFRMYQEVTLKWDSSDNGVYGIDYCLEPGRPFETVHGVSGANKSFLEHRVGLSRVLALCNTNAGESITLYVYEVKPDKAAVLNTLATFTVTDNTEKDSGAQDGPIVHAGFGNSILVRFRGTGWIDTGAYLKVLGEVE